MISKCGISSLSTASIENFQLRIAEVYHLVNLLKPSQHGKKRNILYFSKGGGFREGTVWSHESTNRAQVKLQVNPQQQDQNSNQNKGHQGPRGSRYLQIKVILRKLNLAFVSCEARFSKSFRSQIWLSESDEIMISWWLIASVNIKTPQTMFLYFLSIQNNGAQTVLPSTIPFCHSTTKRCLKVNIQQHSSTSYSPWEPTWITLQFIFRGLLRLWSNIDPYFCWGP